MSRFVVGRGWWPALVYTAFLFAVSSIPGQPGTDSSGYSLLARFPATLQNVLHVPQYAVLSWLWCRGGVAPWLACALSVAYAVGEELYQHTVPGRYSSMTDLALDTIGVAVGIWIYRWWNRPGKPQHHGPSARAPHRDQRP